jgi:outer membrane protein
MTGRGRIAVKRFATVAVGLSILACVVAWPVWAAAQAPAKPPSGPDPDRVSELVRYARTTFDESQAAAQSPQKPSLEERALARPVLQLSVDQAVKMALENNIELAVERLNPTLQDLSILQVKGAYRPTLGSTVNTSSNMPLPTSLLNGGTRVTNETSNFNASLAQALPWFGASYTAAFNNSRTNTTSTFATLNPQYIAQLTGTLTQPLLRNLKIDSTRQSLQTSIITREVSDLTLRARIINTVANTRNAYWDLVHAIRAVAAAKQSLDLAEKLVEDNRVRVEVGTLAPMDIISAQAEAATRRQTLTQAEATRRTTELILKRLIVSSTEDTLWRATVDPTDAVQVLPQAIDLESAVTKALGQRTDLITSRKQLSSNDISIRYLRNQMLPGLDLAATYGTRGLGGNQFIRDGNNGPIIGQLPGGWGDAMNTLRKLDYPSWTVGVTFSYPLGKSTQDAAYARAKVQYEQAQKQLRAHELTVATEVTNAALQVESTLKRLDASRAARQLAEKRLENEQSKFDVGMQTNFFVVQAQRDLLDSQITELRASLDYRKALVEFERVQETSASGGGSVTSVSTGGTTTTTGTTRTTGGQP